MIDGQISYRGEVIGAGTGVVIENAEGLEGFASARVGDADLPRGDGQVPGQHFSDRREVILDLAVFDAAEWDRVRNMFRLSREVAYPLRFRTDGRPERFVNARPVALTDPPRRSSSHLRQVRVGLTCADPRIYGAQRTVTVPLWNPTGGGVDYPQDYPFDWGSAGGQAAVFHNDGNAEAWPVVKVFGPSGGLTGFELVNMTTGVSVEYSGTVASGQVVTFDFHALVTGNGGRVVDLSGANRYGSWVEPRVPFGLAPGDNVLRFIAAAEASCTVQARDTWLS